MGPASHSGCWRATNLLTDWRPREPKRTSTPKGPSRKLRVSEVCQDGADARRHCHPAHGRSSTPNKSVQVVPCSSPWKACTTGKSASGCPRTRLLQGAGPAPLSAPSACRFRARSSCVSGHLPPCPIPRWRCGWVDSGEGLGRECAEDRPPSHITSLYTKVPQYYVTRTGADKYMEGM